MNTRITVDQLEHMKTHELADLLANVVLLLRRMPDVECRQLTAQLSVEDLAEELPTAMPAPTFSADDLRKKSVVELKKIAHDLSVLFNSKTKKDELVSKILARQGHGRSEQYAIQEI